MNYMYVVTEAPERPILSWNAGLVYHKRMDIGVLTTLHIVLFVVYLPPWMHILTHYPPLLVPKQPQYLTPYWVQIIPFTWWRHDMERFRLTGPLWGTGNCWNPLTKGQFCGVGVFSVLLMKHEQCPGRMLKWSRNCCLSIMGIYLITYYTVSFNQIHRDIIFPTDKWFIIHMQVQKLQTSGAGWIPISIRYTIFV